MMTFRAYLFLKSDVLNDTLNVGSTARRFCPLRNNQLCHFQVSRLPVTSHGIFRPEMSRHSLSSRCSNCDDVQCSALPEAAPYPHAKDEPWRNLDGGLGDRLTSWIVKNIIESVQFTVFPHNVVGRRF